MVRKRRWGSSMITLDLTAWPSWPHQLDVHWISSYRSLVRRGTGPKGHWSEGYGVGIHCREVVRIEANTPLSL